MYYTQGKHDLFSPLPERKTPSSWETMESYNLSSLFQSKKNHG